MAKFEEQQEFTYPALVNRWRRERSAASLTRMDGHFYEAFDKHLRGLREDYSREHAANPATPKVLILQDELTNLQRIRDDIYDLREKKIIQAAGIAARGGNPDRSAMTKEEEMLFDEVARVLRDARRNLLRRGAPPQPQPEAPQPRAPAGPTMPLDAVPETLAPAAQPALTAAPVLEVAPEAPLPGAPIPPAPREAPPVEALAAEDAAPRRMGPARTLIRVKEAIAPFVAPDLRQYRLGPEDVASVPKDVAAVLVARGLAVALGA